MALSAAGSYSLVSFASLGKEIFFSKEEEFFSTGET